MSQKSSFSTYSIYESQSNMVKSILDSLKDSNSIHNSKEPLVTELDDDPVFVVTQTKLGSFRSICYNIPKSSALALEGHNENITNGCESVVIYRGIIKAKHINCEPEDSPVLKYILKRKMLIDIDYNKLEQEDFAIQNIRLESVKVPDERLLLVWHCLGKFHHHIYNSDELTKIRSKCETMEKSQISFGLATSAGLSQEYYYFHNEEWKQKILEHMKGLISDKWNVEPTTEPPLKKHKTNLPKQNKKDLRIAKNEKINTESKKILVELPKDQVLIVYHEVTCKILRYYGSDSGLSSAKKCFKELKDTKISAVLINEGKIIDHYYYELEPDVWRDKIIDFINENLNELSLPVKSRNKRKRNQILETDVGSQSVNDLKDVLINQEQDLAQISNFQNDLYQLEPLDQKSEEQRIILDDSSNEGAAINTEFVNNTNMFESNSELLIKDFNLTESTDNNGSEEFINNVIIDTDSHIGSLCPTPSEASGLLGMDQIQLDRSSSTYSIKSEDKIQFDDIKQESKTPSNLTQENLEKASKIFQDKEASKDNNTKLERTDSSYTNSNASDSQKDGSRAFSDMPSLETSTTSSPNRKRSLRIYRRPKDMYPFVWCENDEIRTKIYNKSQYQEAVYHCQEQISKSNSCLLLTTIDDPELYSFYFNDHYEIKIKDAMNRLIVDIKNQKKQ